MFFWVFSNSGNVRDESNGIRLQWPSSEKRHLLSYPDRTYMLRQFIFIYRECPGRISEVDDGIVFLQLDQVKAFMESLQMMWRVRCKTAQCEGRLVPVEVDIAGHGGAAVISLCCSKCGGGEVKFKTAATLPDSRRNIVTEALCLAFVISGRGFAGMERAMGLGLGIQHVSFPIFYSILEEIHPYVKSMLDKVVAETKRVLKAKPDHELGSWKRGAATCDGCWHIRGFFSPNASFVILDYITGMLNKVLIDED